MGGRCRGSGDDGGGGGSGGGRLRHLFDDAVLQQPRRNLGAQPRVRIAVLVQGIGRKRLELEEIHRCRDLVVRLGLDSMDCLELIVGLETEFGVEIDPGLVRLEDFRTVATIAALLWGAAAGGSRGADAGLDA